MATILHIEDDPKSQLLVRKLLTAAGHRVIETSSGLEGARLARDQHPDLVLLDINIPDLDGYEVALLLRGRIPGVPIVAITAEGDRTQSLAVGCDGYVAKPIDVRQFPRQIAAYLAGHRESNDAEQTGSLRVQGQRMAEHLESKVYELSEANQRLVEADRLRKEFYRNVSHELATPLTPIVGYLNLLQTQELGPLAPPQKKAVAAMADALRRLRFAIDNLLDVTQLETGQMRFTFAQFDAADVVRKVVDARRSPLDQKGIRLHVQVPDMAVPCYGDAERVARAVMHMIDNAGKFTPPGGAVALELRASQNAVDLLLSDSGPGVRPEMMARIFEPFVQGDGSPTRQYGGAGVGLAIVRRVAEAHAGHATAEMGGIETVAGQRLAGLLVRFRIARAPRTPTGSS